MPDARLQRASATLPSGYQFGACRHDYRARWQYSGLYYAICEHCGHDAGAIDVSRVRTVNGTTAPAQRRDSGHITERLTR